MESNEPYSHKGSYHPLSDVAKLPYRTTRCDDEYIYDVVKWNWREVNCPLCLKTKGIRNSKRKYGVK